MTTATLDTQAERIARQSKRIRMARAAMDVSSLDQFAQLVSQQYGAVVSAEKLRRIERGERDVEYALLRSIAVVVRDAIADETVSPLEWLGGEGDPVRVNPGSLKDRWLEYVIPGQEYLPLLAAVS